MRGLDLTVMVSAGRRGHSPEISRRRTDCQLAEPAGEGRGAVAPGAPGVGDLWQCQPRSRGRLAPRGAAMPGRRKPTTIPPAPGAVPGT